MRSLHSEHGNFLLLLLVLVCLKRRAQTVLSISGQLFQRGANERIEQTLPATQANVSAVVNVDSGIAAVGKHDRVDGGDGVCAGQTTTAAQ